MNEIEVVERERDRLVFDLAKAESAFVKTGDMLVKSETRAKAMQAVVDAARKPVGLLKELLDPEKAGVRDAIVHELVVACTKLGKVLDNFDEETGDD